MLQILNKYVNQLKDDLKKREDDLKKREDEMKKKDDELTKEKTERKSVEKTFGDSLTRVKKVCFLSRVTCMCVSRHSRLVCIFGNLVL